MRNHIFFAPQLLEKDDFWYKTWGRGEVRFVHIVWNSAGDSVLLHSPGRNWRVGSGSCLYEPGLD
jgi:hypothetical protein